EVELEAELGGALEASVLDVGQSFPAIDLRFAQAQEIEIGSIQNENRRIAGHGRPSALRNLVPYHTRPARSQRVRWPQRDQLTPVEDAVMPNIQYLSQVFQSSRLPQIVGVLSSARKRSIGLRR